MRRFIIALSVVVGLGGCQSVSTALNTSVPNVVTQERVYQAHLAYDALAQAMVSYRYKRINGAYVARPLCLKGQNQFVDDCALRSVVVQIRDINTKARATLAELDRFELTHRGQATFEGTALLLTAAELVNSAKAIIATNRIAVRG